MARLTKWAIFLRAFLAAMVASSANAQTTDAEAEAAAWAQVERAGTAEAYFLYLRRYPRGVFVEQAMSALEQLDGAGAIPAGPAGQDGIQLY